MGNRDGFRLRSTQCAAGDVSGEVVVLMCRIPDDCIDNKRYPLFIAREVMQALIDQLQP